MAMTDGLGVRVSDRLTAAEAAEVQEFLAASPVGTYLQRPDWPDLCPPPRRHSHLCLRAYRDGRLVGWALARLSPLAFGYRLAFLRRGPVTRDVSDLDQVLPAFGRALRKAGVCSMVVNPRWSGDLADEAVHRLSALGAVTLPRGAQSIHRATLLVDLSGGPSDLAARLKSRCRRQISKCEKMGLEVRPAASLDEAMEFSPVLQDFHRRRRLALTNVPSVAQQWEMTRDRGVMLLGRHEGRVICGHSVIVEGDRAFWLSLASTDEPQDMPRNYSLIWAALLHAQAQGLRWYDMAGGPSRIDAPKQETKGLMQDPGRIGRQQFKAAFDPVASELVPMMVIPLVRPVHAVLFSARQRYRAIAGGGWRFAT